MSDKNWQIGNAVKKRLLYLFCIYRCRFGKVSIPIQRLTLFTVNCEKIWQTNGKYEEIKLYEITINFAMCNLNDFFY